MQTVAGRTRAATLSSLLVVTICAPVVACGGVHYAVNATTASARVEEARVAGAERLAPYEYFYAKAHLEQAEIEASEASYSDAASFAETAEAYALKAIEIARSSRSGHKP